MPPGVYPRPPIIERFLSKVAIAKNGCWEWQASCDRLGYGRFRGGENVLAHRVSYELFVGQLKDGLDIDHLCRNTGCVNPAHLEQVTTRENVWVRAINPPGKLQALRTHCPRGHAYDEANTRRRGNMRDCRTCSREVHRPRYLARLKLRKLEQEAKEDKS